MDDELDNAVLLIDGSAGIYLPQDFAIEFGEDVDNVSSDELAILRKGPDSENYWEVWDDVLSEGVVIGSDGRRYRLHQDGDLWAVPIED